MTSSQVVRPVSTLRSHYAPVVAGLAYLGVQAGALAFTESGDWGIGWRRLDLRDPALPTLACLGPSLLAFLALVATV